MKLIKAEVMTIGDEILYGQIIDTNTQWIGTELSKLGIKTIRKTSVGDDTNEILKAFKEAERRADVVIITGGLGPTKDDITKKVLCQHFDSELVINEDALAFITDFFVKRGREMIEINRLQAAVPEKCTYLANKVGTAPGMWFNRGKKVFISLPGVPYEMKWLMNKEVLPRLKTHFKTPIIYHKIIRTIGVGESFLAQQIESWEDNLPKNIKLAYLPNFGQVRLRLTAMGKSEEALKKQVDKEIKKVLPILGTAVFGFDDDDLEIAIGKLLKSKNQTLGVAESCTGGYVSHLLTKVAGSSAYFMGSIISYSNEAKMNILGVKPETLQAHGAVSEETIKEMAEGAKRILGTTYGIATSGIAGPDGGTEEKPVGTIWIACTDGKNTIARKFQATTQRQTNIEYGSFMVLNLLRKMMIK